MMHAVALFNTMLSIRKVPDRGPCMGLLMFMIPTVDDINPALRIIRNIP